MTPKAAIAMLDRMLKKDGEDVLLRRAVNDNTTDVVCRAKVADYRPSELPQGTGMVQGDTSVIISPSEIVRAGWPGDAASKVVGDGRLPMAKDMVVIGGLTRTVKSVAPVYMRGELVKIIMVVSG